MGWFVCVTQKCCYYWLNETATCLRSTYLDKLLQQVISVSIEEVYLCNCALSCTSAILFKHLKTGKLDNVMAANFSF